MYYGTYIIRWYYRNVLTNIERRRTWLNDPVLNQEPDQYFPNNVHLFAMFVRSRRENTVIEVITRTCLLRDSKHWKNTARDLLQQLWNNSRKYLWIATFLAWVLLHHSERCKDWLLYKEIRLLVLLFHRSDDGEASTRFFFKLFCYMATVRTCEWAVRSKLFLFDMRHARMPFRLSVFYRTFQKQRP